MLRVEFGAERAVRVHQVRVPDPQSGSVTTPRTTPRNDGLFFVTALTVRGAGLVLRARGGVLALAAPEQAALTCANQNRVETEQCFSRISNLKSRR